MNTTTPAGDLALFLVLFFVLFLPSIVAFWRGHPRRWWILAVNFLLGGVGVGWIAAWAMFWLPPPYTETGTQATESAEPCPSCGRYYSPADYKAGAAQWLCSYCGEALQRDAGYPS